MSRRHPLAQRSLRMWALVTAVALFGIAAPGAVTRAAELPNPFRDFFECRTGTAEEQQLCSVVRARINDELAAHDIRIDADGVLFGYDDSEHVPLNTGHSCTVTARIERRRLSARVRRGASFSFRGDTISDPLVLGVRLPVLADARFDVKQLFGFRDPFGCHRLGSDSYTASGTLVTDADVGVLFSLVPTLGRNAEGDLLLTIRPTLDLTVQLVNTDIDLRLSGVSPVSGVTTALLATPSTVLRSMFTFDIGQHVALLQRNLVRDLVLAAILDPGPQSKLVLEILETTKARSAARKRTRALGEDLESTLRGGLQRALKLDGEGKRVFVIRKEFAALIEQQGERAEIYRADLPGDCVLGERVVPHGTSVLAYAHRSSTICEPCEAELRTCSDAVLSGSYAAPTCTQRAFKPWVC